MSRPRTCKYRWDSPLHKLGFCYNRNGIVYTDIQMNGPRVREATIYKWDKQNKSGGLSVLDKRIEEFLDPVSLRKSPKTVYWLIKKYKEVHITSLSKTAQSKYRNTCVHFIKRDFLLNQIEDIQEHIWNNLLKVTLRQNTKNKLLSTVRQMFCYALDNGFIKRNPVTRNIIPKIIKTENIVFTRDEVDRLIDHFENSGKNEFSLLLRFIAETGVRINEAIRIEIEDITDDFIKISGKGNKPREFPLEPFPEVEQIIRELQPLSNNGTLFRWNSYAKLEKWVRDALVELGIKKKVNFHAIRKMRENEMIHDEDLGSNIVAQLLGHSRRIQEKHYIEELGAKKMVEMINRKRLKK